MLIKTKHMSVQLMDTYNIFTIKHDSGV